jgi:hypothetical protein
LHCLENIAPADAEIIETAGIHFEKTRQRGVSFMASTQVAQPLQEQCRGASGASERVGPFADDCESHDLSPELTEDSGSLLPILDHLSLLYFISPTNRLDEEYQFQ